MAKPKQRSKLTPVTQGLAMRIGGKKSATSEILTPPPSLTAGNVSMSLYPADQDHIREVQRSLLDHGVQISDSEALRLVIFFRHFQS